MLFVTLLAINGIKDYCINHYRSLMASQTMSHANRIRRHEQLLTHPDRGGNNKEASWLNLCHEIRKRDGPIRIKTVKNVFYERTRMIPSAQISALLDKVPRNNTNELSTEGYVWMDMIVALAKSRPVYLRISDSNINTNYSALHDLIDELFLCDLEDKNARSMVYRFASDERFRARIRIRPTASVRCPLHIARGRIRKCTYIVFDHRRASSRQCVEIRLAPISLYRFDQDLMHNLRHIIIQTRRVLCAAAIITMYVRRHLRGRKLHQD